MGKISEAPEGMAWCSYHQCYEPVEEFGVSRASSNGLQDKCRAGMKVRNINNHAKHNSLRDLCAATYGMTNTEWEALEPAVRTPKRDKVRTAHTYMGDGRWVRKGFVNTESEAQPLHNVVQLVQPEPKQELPEKLVPDLTKKQRKVMVAVRTQQARLRAQVLLIENGCRITGLQDPSSLVAAHIKPHAKGKAHEKVDYDNCILLTPSLHNLFDRGLISFDDEGRLLRSPDLTLEQEKAMGVPAKIENPKPFRAGQLPFLRWHREVIFIKPQPRTQPCCIPPKNCHAG